MVVVGMMHILVGQLGERGTSNLDGTKMMRGVVDHGRNRVDQRMVDMNPVAKGRLCTYILVQSN
jgi:hypothetical protein